MVEGCLWIGKSFRSKYIEKDKRVWGRNIFLNKIDKVKEIEI